MDVKLIEVRDRGTFVPAMAIRLSSTRDEVGDWLLRRAGYSLDGYTVILIRLEDYASHCDVYDWRDTRTRRTVHGWILEHFDELEHGAVVDVECIVGRLAPKVSERLPVVQK
jgi:hypothetical protein